MSILIRIKLKKELVVIVLIGLKTSGKNEKNSNFIVFFIRPPKFPNGSCFVKGDDPKNFLVSEAKYNEMNERGTLKKNKINKDLIKKKELPKLQISTKKSESEGDIFDENENKKIMEFRNFDVLTKTLLDKKKVDKRDKKFLVIKKKVGFAE